MATHSEQFIGTYRVTHSDAKHVETGRTISIISEEGKTWIQYAGQRVEGIFNEGMLTGQFLDPETKFIFRVIIGYYEQRWDGQPWRSIFCLTVDTDPNDAGVWGAEETSNPPS